MLRILQKSLSSAKVSKTMSPFDASSKNQTLPPAPSQDSDAVLQDYFGFKAVSEAQKTNRAMREHTTGDKKQARDAEAKLPSAGCIVESLMRGIPMAYRSIPLWVPATKSNHEWYSTSLALPAPLLRHMQQHHASLPEPFLAATRLGLVYHKICQQRQDEAKRSPPQSKINAENLPDHKSHDIFDRPLQALWTVALCPEAYSRTGAQWMRLGFSSEDPIADIRDGGLSALEDLTWFASTYPAAHREMLLYTSKKKDEASNSHVPTGIADAFSEVAASFLISVMLKKVPKAFADDEGANQKSELSSGGEAASPLLSDQMPHGSQPFKSYSPQHRDGSSLQFTPLMLRYLYGGASEVSMFASATASNNVPRGTQPSQPTGQDEKAMRHRLKQLHSCYLRAYFDLWRREEPLSQELFLLKTFYTESGMIADGYLGRVMS